MLSSLVWIKLCCNFSGLQRLLAQALTKAYNIAQEYLAALQFFKG